MLLKLLDAKSPTYESHIGIWNQCRALYHGCSKFEELIDQFLPMNPKEPADVYASRKREAAYLSYVGPIVDYFVSWLFSTSFEVRAKDSKTGETLPTDEYYNAFQADVGGDINLTDFMRDRFTDALVEQCSHWLIELPSADPGYLATATKADVEAAGLNTAKLCPIDRGQIYDWECDEYGKLQWCIIHDIKPIRPDPRKGPREMVRETWSIYDREAVETYGVTYEKGHRPRPEDDIPVIDPRKPHRFRELPLVTLHVKDGLWIGERTLKPQVEHFRLSAAKGWLVRRTCYAMPVITFGENGDADESRIMGSGYYLKLSEGDKFEWTAPPNTPFDVLSKDIQAQRDEIYRVVHQMAQGLDNNAETVGRSADSKEIDTAATRIMLNAYGSFVRKAIEEMFEMLSDALGDTDVFWSIEGFNGYDTATLPSLIDSTTNIMLLGVPSKTLKRELYTKVALGSLPEADVSVKNVIKKEISDACDAMADLESLDMLPELEVKKQIQEMKGKTAVKVENLKGQNLQTEASMVKREPAQAGSNRA